jgi:hypothetical protein
MGASGWSVAWTMKYMTLPPPALRSLIGHGFTEDPA